MDHVFVGWLAITLLFGAVAILAIWSRTRSVVRGLSVAIFFLAAPFVGLAAASGLGWEVPVIPYITAIGGEYKVIGIKMVQDEAIYVLIDTWVGEPRYYRLRWNQSLADQLQDMMDNPESGGIAMNIPYEFSWDQNAPQFHELPQPPAMPPKDEPTTKAPRFDV